MNLKSLIYIIDDDKSVRKALIRLVRSMGMEGLAFSSVREFIDSDFRKRNVCVIADIKMPGIGGLELPEMLNAKGFKIPIIFITAFDTEDVRKQAKKAGAAGYFRKPVDDQALLDTIQWVLGRQP